MATEKLRTDTLTIPLVKTSHKTPYPAISPLNPKLDQAGRTVLIAGGSTGIGFGIARGFVRAKASRVIILGRRKDVLKQSVTELQAEADKATGTVVEGRICNVADLADSDRLWNQLKREDIFIDVLVLNAAASGGPGPILKRDLQDTWAAFEVNVRMLLDFTQHFYNQEPKRQKVS